VTDIHPHQVVFIDSRVPDIQDLLNGLAPGEQAFVIDSASDGIQQIADILASNNLTDLASISIVAHGAPGELELGSSLVTDQSLASHSTALAEIGASMAPGGNLLLYGCDVGSGAVGMQFLNDLSGLTSGTVIGAATHDVGSSAQGGTWTLDASTGTLTAGAPFTAPALANFQGTLAAPGTVELWVAATEGGTGNGLFHADDTGTGTASNTVTLFTPSSANNPAGVSHLSDVAFDTQNGKYFLDFSSINGSTGLNIIVQAPLSQALGTPGATPTFTTLYSDSSFAGIGGIAADDATQKLYFIEKNRFEVVNEGTANQTPTTLGTAANVSGHTAFIDGLALDAPHGTAYFFSNDTTTIFVGPGSTTSTVADDNGLYVDSNINNAGATLTRLPISPADGTFGGGTNFPSSLGLISGIAVDTTNEILYFTTKSISSSTGGIYKYNLLNNSLGTYSAVWLEPSTGTQVLNHIQIDVTTGKYYVDDQANGDHKVLVGNLNSTLAPTTFLTLPTGAAQLQPLDLVLDNAPTLAITALSATWTEEQTSPSNASLISAAAATDPDNTSLASATVSVSGGFFAGDTLAFTNVNNITGSYNSSTGVLVLSGTDSFANYQTALADVLYHGGENPTDYGSDTSRILAWSVSDGLLTSAPQTSTVSVVFVNDPPTLSGLLGTKAYTEEGGAVTLSGGASVTDVDDLNLKSATVKITGGTFTGDNDVLAVNGVSNGTIVQGAGTITVAYNTSTETLTLTGTDTLAHYQTALDDVTFLAGENPNNFGANPTRTLTWQLTDPSGTANGGNDTSTLSTTTVTITNVNDPPTLSVTSANPTWTEEQTSPSSVSVISGATASDPDNLNLASATVSITGGSFFTGDTLSFTNSGNVTGSYNSSTGVLTFTGSDTFSTYDTVLQSVQFNGGENPTDFGSDTHRTLTWTVNDGALSSAAVTATLSVVGVNDPPTLAVTSANSTWTEHGTSVAIISGATASDPDNLNLATATVSISGGSFFTGDTLSFTNSGAVTGSYDSNSGVLTFTGSDTLATYNTVLQSVKFSGGENPTDFGSDTQRTLSWTVNDGTLSSGAVTATLSVANVDDPPTLAVTPANTTWTEEQTSPSSVAVISGATASDPDNLNLATATVSISGGSFFTGDTLSFTNSGAVTGSYNSTTGVLVFTGSDTLATYNTVLQSVRFNGGENPTDFGSDTHRTLSWTVNDGTLSSAAVSVTLSVVGVNDPPTLSNVATNAAFTEEGGAVTLSSGASVTDPDNLDLAGATVSITAGGFAGDKLAANGVSNGTVVNGGNTITISYNSTTETLTLTGTDTLADYQFLLDHVTFNAGENPNNFGSNPTRTLAWVLNDGSSSNSLSTTATTTVTVTNVNDPPTLGNVASNAFFTEEGGAVALSSAVSVADPDNLNLVGATVSITAGGFAGDVLSATTTGTSITVAYNSTTETLTLTGSDTLAHYQTVLDSITFNAGENPNDFGSNPTRTLTWVLNDGGISNNLSTAVTSTISVTNVNDPPTLAGVVPSVNVQPTFMVTLSPSVTITDPDDLNLKSATVSITGGTFAGDGDVLAAEGQTSGTIIQNGNTITVAYNTSTETLTLTGTDTLADYQTVLDRVTFKSTAIDPTNSGANSTRTITWVVQDASGIANGGSDSSTPATETVQFDIPPTLSGVAPNASWFEEAPPTTLSPNLTVSDPDGVNTDNSATVSITGGKFLNDGDVLSATPVGSITVSYNSSTETLTLTGSDTLANYQQVLDSVTFNAGENPTNFGANPTRTLTWVIADHVNVASALVTTTVSITNINDPPTLGNVATNASFTEHGGAVTLSSAVSVTDPDDTTISGARVSITSGGFTGDVLSAIALGNITVSYNSSTETLALTGSDTLARYQSVLDSVTFNASENPDDFGSNPTRTLTWVLNDGVASNNLSTVVTSTVSITNVDDPPTLAVTSANATWTEEGASVPVITGATASDPDNLTLASATVSITGSSFFTGDTLNFSNAGSVTGSYNSNTGVLTFTGSDSLAAYNTALASVQFSGGQNPTDFGSDTHRTLTWTVNDGTLSSAAVTATLSVVNVNDPPTVSNIQTTTSYTEEHFPAFVALNATVTDPDSLNLVGATVKITGGTFAGDGDVLNVGPLLGTSIAASYNSATETLTLTGTDTLAHYQDVLQGVSFFAGENPTNFGSNPTRTLTWTLNDGAGSFSQSSAVTTTVSIGNVNDPPTLSNVATSASYTEEGAATTLSSAVSVSDPDDVNLAGATVRVTGGAFAGDGDVLATSVAGTNITASYNAATETLALSGADTLARYQQVLDHVTFAAGENPTDFGSNPTRTVTWTLNDGAASSNLSTPVTTTVSVTNVNDPPTLANVAASAAVPTTGAIVTLSPVLAVSDPDNLKLASATVAVSGGFAGDGDVLGFNTAGTSITASYNAATETLTLTGTDTLAHYQSVLDQVTFTSGANPTNSGANPTRTVSWVVNDGSASNNLSAAATTTITFQPVLRFIGTGDFDGNGRTDIAWASNGGGQATMWMNTNGTLTQFAVPGAAMGAGTWTAYGVGDFNGDGKSDLLWTSNTGQVAVWEMNGPNLIGFGVPAGQMGAGEWHVAAIGDFNGDGKSDLLWVTKNGGYEAVWTMNGTMLSSFAISNGAMGPEWSTLGTGDFNQDGRADVLWENTSGTVDIWEMNGSNLSGFDPNVGTAPGRFGGVGHFTGASGATSDIVWVDANNHVTIWQMTSGRLVNTVSLNGLDGTDWRLQGVGNFAGDANSDLLWVNNNTGAVNIWEVNGSSVTEIPVNAPTGSALKLNAGTQSTQSTQQAAQQSERQSAPQLLTMSGALQLGSEPQSEPQLLTMSDPLPLGSAPKPEPQSAPRLLTMQAGPSSAPSAGSPGVVAPNVEFGPLTLADPTRLAGGLQEGGRTVHALFGS
jgi:hypothetical protein